ncbi:helix-turn-helix transcriptional regulator [Burkholderiaceae bacterium UC74_6]
MPLQQPHQPSRAQSASTTFLRLPSVLRITGLGRSTIYRMVADNRFPRPVRIGQRAIAWRRSDLESWGKARPSSH